MSEEKVIKPEEKKNRAIGIKRRAEKRKIRYAKQKAEESKA